jgi:uncharacterized protein YjbJ (UPF0337 family)
MSDGKLDELKGTLKEGLGKASDDEQLEGEGKADQVKGNVKQGVDKLKDAVHDATR